MHAELVESGWITPSLEYPTYRALWRKLSSRPADRAAVDVGRRPEAFDGGSRPRSLDYCEPPRRYHTLEHIDEMLAVCDRLA